MNTCKTCWNEYDIKVNTLALFNELNQWANKITWYYCSLFAPAINLKYNCWIKLTVEDLIMIWKKQEDLGLLDRKMWGLGSDWINVIYQFVKDNSKKRNWTIPNLKVFKSYQTKELLKFIDKWYMFCLWIWVNKAFIEDKNDNGILDLADYDNYKWELFKHFTNIARWKNRFNGKKTWKYNKEYFIDSYAFNKKGNKWIFECDINEVLEDIAFNTKYIFY